MEEDKSTIETSFTHEALKRQQKQNSDRVMRRFVMILVLGVTAFVLYVVHISRCNYYEIIETESTEDNSSVAYEPFKKGYIKYSDSGIEYQEKFGTAIWNESITLQNPLVALSEEYVLVTNRGGSRLAIYDETGKVSDIRLSYSVMQASISNNGVCEVIVQKDDTNLVQVYDKDGNLLVDAKTSIGETGYPVTAAVSPDGTKLAISSYSLQNTNPKTIVTVYYLGDDQKEDGNTKLGSMTYDDEIVPKLYFYDEEHLAACGDGNLYFYNVEDSMRESETVAFDGNVQTVFTEDQVLGVILNNTGDISQGNYVLYTYNAKGHLIFKRVIDMSYEKLDVRNKQLFAIYKNNCTIMDIKGRILFQGELDEGGIVTIVPAGGWRNYHVILNDKVVKMRLQFLSR